ncbi:MAG TPA: hypothetical protein VLL04_05095, partial [Rhizomicrobium sp.]|nr:hypothetical protein [Rhizomicrobium sp.]
IASPDAGLLLKNRDAESIVSGIGQLRRAMPDRAATRRYAERFDWQSTTDGQVAIFRSMLANR